MIVTGPTIRQLTITPEIGRHGVDHYAGGHRRHRHRHHQLRALGPRAHLLPRRGRDRRVLRYLDRDRQPQPADGAVRSDLPEAGRDDGRAVGWPGGPSADHHRRRLSDGPRRRGVSTVVSATNGQPLVVERTMRWGATRTGRAPRRRRPARPGTGTSPKARRATSRRTSCCVNPQPTANVARVTYFRETRRAAPDLPAGRVLADHDRRRRRRRASQPLVRRARRPSIWPARRSGRWTWQQPAVAGRPCLVWPPAPSTTWFLAEGATGSYFTTFVLIANPNDQPVEVTLTYLPASGIPVTRTATIAAGQRLTRTSPSKTPRSPTPLSPRR